MVATHINLASFIRDNMHEFDNSQIINLEQNIILGEDASKTLQVLESKMVKGYDKHKILRMLALLSVT